MDRELIFEKLEQIIERDSAYEVLMACAKILFCTNIGNETNREFCLDHESCQKIINKIHKNLSNLAPN